MVSPSSSDERMNFVCVFEMTLEHVWNLVLLLVLLVLMDKFGLGTILELIQELLASY